MRSGISARHGGHHVAQKFTSTTLPRKSAIEIVRPLRSVTEKSAIGAGSLRSWTTTGSPEADPTGVPSGGEVPFEQAAAALVRPKSRTIVRASLARFDGEIIRLS